MGIPAILAIAGTVALVVSLASIPLVIRLADRKGWYDLPNGRKVHTNPLPRLGGVGIFAAILVAMVLGVALSVPRGRMEVFGFDRRLLFVLAGFLLIFATGLVDDFRNLRAPLKFFLQLAAGVLVTLGGFTIDALGLPGLAPLGLGWLAWPLTVLWLVGLSNAMNLVDGVDGFAGAITAAAAAALGAMALMQGRFGAALVACCLLGAAAGFLAFNFPPARIFMGDSGSLLLGFVLATLPLLRGSGQPDGAALTLDLAATIAVLGLPVLDTATAIVRRVRAGHSIARPDKLHLHHKLQAIGLSDRALFLVALASGLVLGAVAFGAVLVGGWWGWAMMIGGAVVLCALYALMRLVALPRMASAENPPQVT
jgi:UDP-GlcNAc:undecaprenyl-phosphate/decaprenyl-phosphate GlcNAc-1-phosphate transferase